MVSICNGKPTRISYMKDNGIRKSKLLYLKSRAVAILDSSYTRASTFAIRLIELMINKLHGLSPSGGLVSPSGGFASLLFDQGLHFTLLV